MTPVKVKPRIPDDEYPGAPDPASAPAFTLERRDFLKLAGGGLVVIFAAGDALDLEGQEGQRRAGQAQGQGYPDDPNAYLKIGADGRVTCLTGKIEMGQGTLTALQMMAADELDVPLDRVDMIMGDTALCPYDAGTFGSRSIKYFGPALRQAAAEAKAVLVRLASGRLGAPEDALATKDGAVHVIAAPAQKITYADLVGGRRIEVRLEQKPPSEPLSKHTITDHPTPRTDARVKVTGAAQFTGDIRVPGMVYASILRPPAHGARLKSVNTTPAAGVPGAQVVRDGELVAVLHDKPDQAARACALIKAEFDPSPSTLDNSNIFPHLREVSTRSDTVVESGNLDQGAKLAAKLVERSYYAQYVAHAPSEPHTALVRIVDGTKAEVWASTQSPFRVQQDIARVLGFDSANVRVRTPFVGCGFGGKNAGPQIIEAARLAKLSGKPVQVAYSRKEEFFYDTFRPACVYDVRSGLDAENRIVLWDFKIYQAGSRSSQPVYDIPHKRVLAFGGGFGADSGVHPFGTGAWRGPGSNTNIFATESHVDLMAETAGQDPLSFRLANLADDRMKKVVTACADTFARKFSRSPSGRGTGIAITDYLGTYVATMAEVEVDQGTGEVRVKRVVCAQDTGEVVNPEGARMQIEGCITMGLGYCFSEEIQFQNGRILDENFDSYRLPRLSWLPKIEVVLVDNPDLPPSGCGEPAITPMGAVIANAIHDAIGVRLDTLPMTPARIKEALARKS